MKKSKIMKVPLKVYDFLKLKSKENKTTMKSEANNMMEDYLKLKKLESYLEKRRGKIFIIK